MPQSTRAVFVVALALGSLLSQTGCTESVDDHGMTALHRAADSGDVAEIRRLLKSGANVHAKVEGHNMFRVIFSVMGGFKPLPSRQPGWTPLHFAVARGHVDAARVLIQAGAVVKTPEDSGMSLLITAILHKNVPLVTMLLDAGADPGKRPFPNPPLVVATTAQSDELVALLLSRAADVNGKDAQNRTPLHTAAARGNGAITRRLLEAGADVNVRDSVSNWTPLEWAVHHGHEEVAALLRGAGAVDDGAANRALLDAIRRKDLAGAEKALAEGASPNARDVRGDSALVLAIEWQAGDIAQRLIAEGADVLEEHRYLGPVAVLAAQRRQRTVVEAMLATKRLGQPELDRALAAASAQGSAELVALLLRAGARVSGPGALLGAIRSGNVELARTILDAGGDPNARTQSGTTPLLAAASAPHSAEQVRLLLDRGAQVNVRDVSGYTPLIMSLSEDRLETLKLLIEAGADVNARDEDGVTALGHARKRGLRRAAELLERAGGTE